MGVSVCINFLKKRDWKSFMKHYISKEGIV